MTAAIRLPDLIVGLGSAAMKADAAREVWQAARDELRFAELRERIAGRQLSSSAANRKAAKVLAVLSDECELASVSQQ
jgi:hypothetical protein